MCLRIFILFCPSFVILNSSFMMINEKSAGQWLFESAGRNFIPDQSLLLKRPVDGLGFTELPLRKRCNVRRRLLGLSPTSGVRGKNGSDRRTGHPQFETSLGWNFQLRSLCAYSVHYQPDSRTFSRFYSCCTSAHVSTFVGVTWVWNGRLVRVRWRGGDPNRVTASPPPTRRQRTIAMKAIIDPLFKDTRCCDECIITSIFVLFLCLREPTKKKKKKLKKWGGPSRPSRPACDGLEYWFSFNEALDIRGIRTLVSEQMTPTLNKFSSHFPDKDRRTDSWIRRKECYPCQRNGMIWLEN